MHCCVSTRGDVSMPVERDWGLAGTAGHGFSRRAPRTPRAGSGPEGRDPGGLKRSRPSALSAHRERGGLHLPSLSLPFPSPWPCRPPAFASAPPPAPPWGGRGCPRPRLRLRHGGSGTSVMAAPRSPPLRAGRSSALIGHTARCTAGAGQWEQPSSAGLRPLPLNGSWDSPVDALATPPLR